MAFLEERQGKKGIYYDLRSSCENDWIRDGIPPHVVASWIGHSVRTQEVYYLRVLPEYFDRVTV